MSLEFFLPNRFDEISALEFFYNQIGQDFFSKLWYFVTKIVLTYREKKFVLLIEKNF